MIQRGWCHLTMACLIRGEPAPCRASLVQPAKPIMYGGRGDAEQTPLTRREDRGESTQRTDVPTRVRGETGEAQSRISGEDWQPAHGSTAKPGSRGAGCRVWVGRHMRSMCVTAGWGSHRHDNGAWEFRRLCNSAERPLKTPALLGHGNDQRSARRINEGAYRVVRESGCRLGARLVVRKEQRSSPDYRSGLE